MNIAKHFTMPELVNKKPSSIGNGRRRICAGPVAGPDWPVAARLRCRRCAGGWTRARARCPDDPRLARAGGGAAGWV